MRFERAAGCPLPAPCRLGVRFVEAREKPAFGAIEGPADFGIVELYEAVCPKPAPEIYISANRYRAEIGSEALGAPAPSFDLASGTRQRACNLRAEKLQASLDDRTAEQQAAVDPDTVAADPRNGSAVKAHNFRFCIGEAEFASNNTILYPKRPHLGCTVEINRAIDVSALDPQSAFVNGRLLLPAERQKAQEIRSDLVRFGRRVGARPGERALFAALRGGQQCLLRR